MASIFLSEEKEFHMQKVKEERVKQKFEESGENSRIFSKRSGKGSWQWSRRILSNTTDHPTRVSDFYSMNQSA